MRGIAILPPLAGIDCHNTHIAIDINDAHLDLYTHTEMHEEPLEFYTHTHTHDRWLATRWSNGLSVSRPRSMRCTPSEKARWPRHPAPPFPLQPLPLLLLHTPMFGYLWVCADTSLQVLLNSSFRYLFENSTRKELEIVVRLPDIATHSRT